MHTQRFLCRGFTEDKSINARPGLPLTSGFRRPAGGLAADSQPPVFPVPPRQPDELVLLDREKMRELPPVALDTVFRNAVRLPQDYYVRVFSND